MGAQDQGVDEESDQPLELLLETLARFVELVGLLLESLGLVFEFRELLLELLALFGDFLLSGAELLFAFTQRGLELLDCLLTLGDLLRLGFDFFLALDAEGLGFLELLGLFLDALGALSELVVLLLEGLLLREHVAQELLLLSACGMDLLHATLDLLDRVLSVGPFGGGRGGRCGVGVVWHAHISPWTGRASSASRVAIGLSPNRLNRPRGTRKL